jgi:hypothetical protein
MDRWKAEQGRGRETRKIRREKIRRERVRRKKMQMREKVGKSRNTVFFQWFVAPEGRKVGSLKRRVRSQLARWEFFKNCIQLWCEAHFDVKMHKAHEVRTTFWSCDGEKVRAILSHEAHFDVKLYKTLQPRSTFGSWDFEKVHAVVAWSTFRSQNVQNTPGLDHFWKLRFRKSARRCGAKHISVKMLKTRGVRTTLGGSDVVSRGRRKGLWTLSKVSKTWVLLHVQKRWQAWGIGRGSANMHFPWQAQYKRYVHQSC